MCELVRVIYVKLEQITAFSPAGACGLVPKVINTIFFLYVLKGRTLVRLCLCKTHATQIALPAGGHQPRITRVNLTCWRRRRRRLRFACVLCKVVRMSDVCITNHAAAYLEHEMEISISEQKVSISLRPSALISFTA